MLFKFSEKHKHFYVDVTKHRACFCNIKFKHQKKKNGLVKCDSANCAWEEILGTHLNIVVLDKIIFNIGTSKFRF